MVRLLLLLLGILASSTVSGAQQTILNIPSADITDKKQINFRLDTSCFPSIGGCIMAPNFIFGVGHNIEAGININAFGVPASLGNRSIVPNFKWRFLNGKADAKSHFDMFVGDQIFFPTFQRTFDVGNYLYAAVAWTIHSNTRFTAGAY